MFGINKKKVNKPAERKRPDEQKATNASSSSAKKSVPDLICKSFVDGCLVLGCVHDVSNSELIVSLPGIGNYGHVKLNNISKIYSNLLKNELKNNNDQNNENSNNDEDEGTRTLVEMYNKSDLVRCKVLNFTNRKLYLTIEPNEVNNSLTYDNLEENMIISGSIKTREDHGYTIDLGIGDLTGFYKINTSQAKLCIGQTCLFKIVGKTSKRAISLKLCDATESLFYDLRTRNQFDSYLPGSRLNQCTVEKVSKNGLQLALPNQLFAYVHINHIPAVKRQQKLAQSFNVGDKLTGTIIFINPYSKVIYLSLLTHLIDSTRPSKLAQLFVSSANDAQQNDSLKLGQIVDDAQVSMHTFKGLYVKFKGPEAKQVIGFIPKRHLQDSLNGQESDQETDAELTDKGERLTKTKKDAKNMELEEIEKLFPLNSTLRARVYDFNLIEDMILLSCRSSVLSAQFMSYDELQVGQIVKCTVKCINAKNGGVSVDLSEFLHGFIPKIHTSDIPLSETLLAKKLKPDSEIKCRIIQLNVAEKRCILTAKKTLLKSKLKLIDSFDGLEQGAETYGTVIAIKDFGLLLGFMNEIKGILPRQEISKTLSKDQNLNELYYLGQLMKCKVKYFNAEKQALKLSLLMDDEKLKAEQSSSGSEPKKFDKAYEIGDLISESSCTILQVNEENQYFRVKLPHGSKMGILYKNHLSDLDSLNEFLFEYYKRQMKIENQNLMIINDSASSNKLNKSDKKASSYYLTMKTTLIAFYSADRSTPTSPTDLQVNKYYHGWIRNIINNGVLVELPSNLSGYCSKEKISYIHDDLKLSVGQSVLFKINKLFENDEKKRFLTSLKTQYDLSQKSETDQKYILEYFESYVNGLKQVYSLFEQQNNLSTLNKNIIDIILAKVNANDIRIGSVVQCVVKSFNRASGLLECLFMKDLDFNQNDLNSGLNLTCFAYASPDEAQNDVYRQGAKLEALVLAFDPLTRTFCLTTDKKSVKAYRKNFDPTFQKQIICKKDQSIKAEVLFVGQWFCIVGLKAHAHGRLAFMPLFKNDFTQLNRYMSMHSDVQNSKLDSADLKIRQKQVLNVSAASLSSLSFSSMSAELSDRLKNEAEQKDKKAIRFKKEDKRFSYFYVGQSLNVIIKSGYSNQENNNYMIVFDDLDKAKRNKKLLLRQLAILNENHTNESSNDSAGIKRKRSNPDNDEEFIVKKKLILNGEKNGKSKRNLSETSQADENNVDRDFIEIVTDVKKVKLDSNEKKKSDADAAHSMFFPWECNDFDQFYSIINKLDENSNENNDQNASSKAKNKEKAKQAPKLDDRTIFEREEQIFDPNREPENADDYERLIAAQPNSSLLWIKYIVFYLQMAEIEKARSIAEQALKKILFNQDQERLNVWVALLNLENMYGTPESLEKVFNRATQNCDSLKVHFHMAEIYARAAKQTEAETVFVKMTKKFGRVPDVWIKYGIFHYKNSHCELARKLLLKSFNSLDKKDHIDMVNKFAQLEFKYGDVERAKTMYDSLLFTYPNRTDIWSVYIDMLVKHQLYEEARQIFNRIIQMGLTVKRMKFVFKKFIDFEKLHGNEETIEKVRVLATGYVEKKETNKENNSKTSSPNSMEEHLKKKLLV